MGRLRQSDKIDALRRIPLFADLSKRQLAFLARQVTEMRVEAGTVLVKEGDRGREAMVITSGSAVVQRGGRTVDEISPGDVVGEMSLLTRQPRNATVIATSEVGLLLMTDREFADVLAANPDVSLKVLRTMAERLGQAG
jgi:CRP-like cAMP-binding protein